MSASRPLYVTRPELPPLEDFLPLLEDIWESRILSNDGRYHQQFEAALKAYLNVDHVSLVCNATMGLQLALRQCAQPGQVITTPFSFVATTHAVALSGMEPVFADIDPVSLNLHPAAVEAAITPDTRAIMPVHIFGRGCDTKAFARLAQEHNLTLIYDAAQALGLGDAGGSVLRHGDMSVLSFHATKVFNTFEGGAVICRDAETKQKIDDMRNFGIIDEVTVAEIGTNAKMNELNAAVGLLQLNHINELIDRRRETGRRYRDLFADVDGIECLPALNGQKPNYGSFPVLVQPGAACTRDDLYERLREHDVYARRYFYPLISELPMYRQLPSAYAGNLTVAHDIANRVLCLPLFPDLQADEQQRIVSIIADEMARG